MDLLKLNSDVIHRRANGKTIWQPRICCWYDDRMFRHEELPGKFKGCDRRQLYLKLGCSDRLYYFNGCFGAHYDETVKVSGKSIGPNMYESVIETPEGKVNQITRSNLSNNGVMPVKWYVEMEDDLRVMAYVEEHTVYTYSQEHYDMLYRDYSCLGLPAVFMPRSGLQKLLIELAGVENTYYLIADCPDAVESYFAALSKSQEGYLRLAAESPFEWINYGENLHCKVTPPEYFKKYILPEYEKRRSFLAPKGKILYAHFDGDIKDYIPYMKSGCFLDGFEALTPEPQGDVTLEEMKEAVGDRLLIDGIAAVLFSVNYPVEELIKQTERVLEMFEGQLVLGISDEIASDGSLDRVELVRDMVEEFNAKR